MNIHTHTIENAEVEHLPHGPQGKARPVAAPRRDDSAREDSEGNLLFAHTERELIILHNGKIRKSTHLQEEVFLDPEELGRLAGVFDRMTLSETEARVSHTYISK